MTAITDSGYGYFQIPQFDFRIESLFPLRHAFSHKAVNNGYFAQKETLVKKLFPKTRASAPAVQIGSLFRSAHRPAPDLAKAKNTAGSLNKQISGIKSGLRSAWDAAKRSFNAAFTEQGFQKGYDRQDMQFALPTCAITPLGALGLIASQLFAPKCVGLAALAMLWDITKGMRKLSPGARARVIEEVYRRLKHQADRDEIGFTVASIHIADAQAATHPWQNLNAKEAAAFFAAGFEGQIETKKLNFLLTILKKVRANLAFVGAYAPSVSDLAPPSQEAAAASPAKAAPSLSKDFAAAAGGSAAKAPANDNEPVMAAFSAAAAPELAAA